jgi:hypothetical protein
VDHHEIDGRGPAVRRGSDRGFGLTFAAALALLGAAPLRHGGQVRFPALVAAASLLIVAVAAPRLLRPFAGLWFRVGLILHRFTSPIALGAVYFLVLTPTGLVLRLFQRDPLRLGRDPRARSYWIECVPPDAGARSMQRQF